MITNDNKIMGKNTKENEKKTKKNKEKKKNENRTEDDRSYILSIYLLGFLENVPECFKGLHYVIVRARPAST